MSWTFIYLMFILKIPIVGLLWLVWWAIHQEPEEASVGDEDGGSKLRPRHPRPRLPRSPRRGPHGDPAPQPPVRTRSVVARARPLHR
ncbi:MAG TPA: hypothetical protein VGN69_08885 [Solirubrobacteraceae bacterium]|jgi:hypothetical protein|nr:hypothetical protein [Solirubrobacteraceae bacterium]